jgi:hypothetical protein
MYPPGGSSESIPGRSRAASKLDLLGAYELFDWMKKRDLYFIIGTHFIYGTPLIISLFYPEYYGESLDNFAERPVGC